jgi:hypothetical protein
MAYPTVEAFECLMMSQGALVGYLWGVKKHARRMLYIVMMLTIGLAIG